MWEIVSRRRVPNIKNRDEGQHLHVCELTAATPSGSQPEDACGRNVNENEKIYFIVY